MEEKQEAKLTEEQLKERRSEALKRAWDSRRAIFGPTGISPASKAKRALAAKPAEGETTVTA